MQLRWEDPDRSSTVTLRSELSGGRRTGGINLLYDYVFKAADKETQRDVPSTSSPSVTIL